MERHVGTRKRALSDGQRLRITAKSTLLLATLDDDALVKVARQIRGAARLSPGRSACSDLDHGDRDVARVPRAGRHLGQTCDGLCIPAHPIDIVKT